MIIEAHKWLEEQKILNKLSYKKLGDPIGYSDTGIKKAFKNYTLNLIQIKKIAQDLELNKTKSNFSNFNIQLLNEEGNSYDIDHIKPKSQITDSEKLEFIYKTVKDLKCDMDFMKLGLASLLDEDSK